MNAYSSSGPNFARCMEDIVENVHDDIRQAVDYIDTAVVPRVRKETGAALRLLASHLERWADSLHRSVQA